MVCIDCGGRVDTSERVKDVMVMRTACSRGWFGSSGYLAPVATFACRECGRLHNPEGDGFNSFGKKGFLIHKNVEFR